MKKIILILTVIMVLLISLPVFAHNNITINYEASESKIIITATLPDAPNRVCAVICGMYETEPEAQDALQLLVSADYIIGYDHIATDASGNLTHSFKINEDAVLGEYYIVVSDESNFVISPFVYYSEAGMSSFIKVLCSNNNESEFVDEFMKAYHNKQLPVLPESFGNLSEEQQKEVASLVFSSKTTELDAFKSLCNDATEITFINSSDDLIGSVISKSDEIGINADDYENLTDEQKEYFRDIFPVEFRSYNEIKDSFFKSVVLSIASKPKTYMEIKEAITMYDDYAINVDGDYSKLSNKNAVYKKMVVYDFKTFDDLQDCFDNAVVAQKIEEKSSSNSKGFGGSNGSYGGSVSVPKDEYANGDNTQVENKFTDLSGYEWGQEAVISLAAKNIINGDGSGNFRPGDSVTRAEFVKMLVLALGVDNPDAEVTFNDVDAGNWAYPYIASASSLGIIKGMGDGMFVPDAHITREDMSVIIHRAAVLFEIDFSGTGETFADEEDISPYAVDAVGALSAKGIIKGTDSGFMPKDNTNRVQAALVIYRLLDMID